MPRKRWEAGSFKNISNRLCYSVDKNHKQGPRRKRKGRKRYRRKRCRRNRYRRNRYLRNRYRPNRYRWNRHRRNRCQRNWYRWKRYRRKRYRQIRYRWNRQPRIQILAGTRVYSAIVSMDILRLGAVGGSRSHSEKVLSKIIRRT